jgi:hypothetical protein
MSTAFDMLGCSGEDWSGRARGCKAHATTNPGVVPASMVGRSIMAAFLVPQPNVSRYQHHEPLIAWYFVGVHSEDAYCSETPVH